VKEKHGLDVEILSREESCEYCIGEGDAIVKTKGKSPVEFSVYVNEGGILFVIPVSGRVTGDNYESVLKLKSAEKEYNFDPLLEKIKKTGFKEARVAAGEKNIFIEMVRNSDTELPESDETMKKMLLAANLVNHSGSAVKELHFMMDDDWYLSIDVSNEYASLFEFKNKMAVNNSVYFSSLIDKRDEEKLMKSSSALLSDFGFEISPNWSLECEKMISFDSCGGYTLTLTSNKDVSFDDPYMKTDLFQMIGHLRSQDFVTKNIEIKGLHDEKNKEKRNPVYVLKNIQNVNHIKQVRLKEK